MSAPTQPLRSAPAGRIATARRLLRRDHFGASLALARQVSLGNSVLAGAQTAVTAGLAVPVLHFSPWPELTGYGALGALVALFARFAPRGRRLGLLWLCALWQVLAVLSMSALAALALPMGMQLLALALACGLFYLVTASSDVGAPGALIFVFAAGAALHGEPALPEIAARGAATAAVAGLALLVCALTEAWRPLPSEARPFPAEPRRPLSHRLFAASRICIATAIAGLASHAFGADHPVWAAMGALAVLQGAYLHVNLSRAVQRMAGTVVGSILAWVILLQEPGLWEIVAVIMLLQLLTEVVIGFNYALGLIFVTPMALVMTSLATPGAAGAAMAPERVLDTLLGASVGLATAILLSTLDDRRHLAGLGGAAA